MLLRPVLTLLNLLTDQKPQGLLTSPLRGRFPLLLILPEGKARPSDSDSESVTSDRPPVDLYREEGELSDDHEVSFTDPDQSLSEEQSY